MSLCRISKVQALQQLRRASGGKCLAIGSSDRTFWMTRKSSATRWDGCVVRARSTSGVNIASCCLARRKRPATCDQEKKTCVRSVELRD